MKTEFELINHIKKKSQSFNFQYSPVRCGIGDDCAVIEKNGKTDVVITTDLLVEDVDFRLDWTMPEFLGHKALAVSLSDIASMGAKPVWAMLSIGVPARIWKTDFVERFYDGWFALAKKFNVELVGGDVSRTPDKIVVDSIAAGEAKKNKAVLRSGARDGDLIFVTGALGGAAAALKLLESGERFEKSPNKNLFLRQLQPQPQTKVGQILGKENLATAMIDLSDGLSSDLAHLCRASNVGAKIYADKIPLDANFKNLSRTKKYKTFFSDKLNFALNGGEDFELLFTVNPKKISRLKEELKNFSFSHIGEITAHGEMIELNSEGKSEILHANGFRHF
ncbi:MAG: thiamine-phosphate kinase [Acidobacteria bacterium]|nr:thiamine-phosphate kinase [Acidobacteriota bacterium]